MTEEVQQEEAVEKTDEEILYPDTKEEKVETEKEGDDDAVQQEDGKQEEGDSEEDSEEEESSEEEDDEEKSDEEKSKQEDVLKFDVKDIENPDETYVAKEDIERIVSEGKKLGLSKEQVQWMVDERAETLSGLAEALQNQTQETHTQWREETKADKEIGGENLDASIRRANTFLDRFGTPEAKELLDAEGLGNHKEVIRILARAGAAMEDDKFVVGGKHTNTSDKPMEEIFYGSN